MESLLHPAILFFIVGLAAGVLRTDFRLPGALYETLSIFLLLTLGLKGGIQLSKTGFSAIAQPLLGAVVLSFLIPLIAYFILRKVGKLSIPDSAAIGAHYGSASAVTYAVVLQFLEYHKIPYESFSTVLLVVMEIPAILVGIFIAKWKASQGRMDLKKIFHEVFLGKSVYLMMSGLFIGYFTHGAHRDLLDQFFVGAFKGVLVFFLLEMGYVVSQKLGDLKKAGVFPIIFAILMPMLAAILGAFVGALCGLSLGGITILATIAASASYIAAPAAVRMSIPEANLTLCVAMALGITFPFNVLIGIPIYYSIAGKISGFAP